MKIKKLFKRILNKEVIAYIFFGLLTTGINLSVYSVLIERDCNYIVATTVAFIISIIFAFVTNRKYVFIGNASGPKFFLLEFYKFFIARLATYFFDVLALIIMIQMLNFGELVSKVIINIIVIGLNYVLSKHFVFK